MSTQFSDRNIHPPDDTAGLPSDSIEQNTQAIENLATDVAALHYQAEAAKQLKKRVNWLTGLLVGSLVVLGGGLIGTTLSLKNNQANLRSTQEELSQQIESASDAQSDLAAGAEQLSQIQQQLQTLNQQAQTLTTQARDLSDGLSEGVANVSSEQWADLREKLNGLEQTIQDGVSGEATAPEAAEQLNQIQEVLQKFRETLSSVRASAETPETEEQPAN